MIRVINSNKLPCNDGLGLDHDHCSIFRQGRGEDIPDNNRQSEVCSACLHSAGPRARPHHQNQSAALGVHPEERLPLARQLCCLPLAEAGEGSPKSAEVHPGGHDEEEIE